VATERSSIDSLAALCAVLYDWHGGVAGRRRSKTIDAMRILSSILHSLWWTTSIVVVALASLSLPVQCRCGDRTPGPHALIVVADRFAPAVKHIVGRDGPVAAVPEGRDSPGVSEMPTRLDWGLGTAAVAVLVGALLLLPRQHAPLAVVRILFGRTLPPHAPPPRRLWAPVA
jgi:hypothetical protein